MSVDGIRGWGASFRKMKAISALKTIDKMDQERNFNIGDIISATNYGEYETIRKSGKNSNVKSNAIGKRKGELLTEKDFNRLKRAVTRLSKYTKEGNERGVDPQGSSLSGAAVVEIMEYDPSRISVTSLRAILQYGKEDLKEWKYSPRDVSDCARSLTQNIVNENNLLEFIQQFDIKAEDYSNLDSSVQLAITNALGKMSHNGALEVAKAMGIETLEQFNALPENTLKTTLQNRGFKLAFVKKDDIKVLDTVNPSAFNGSPIDGENFKNLSRATKKEVIKLISENLIEFRHPELKSQKFSELSKDQQQAIRKEKQGISSSIGKSGVTLEYFDGLSNEVKEEIACLVFLDSIASFGKKQGTEINAGNLKDLLGHLPNLVQNNITGSRFFITKNNVGNFVDRMGVNARNFKKLPQTMQDDIILFIAPNNFTSLMNQMHITANNFDALDDSLRGKLEETIKDSLAVKAENMKNSSGGGTSVADRARSLFKTLHIEKKEDFQKLPKSLQGIINKALKSSKTDLSKLLPKHN